MEWVFIVIIALVIFLPLLLAVFLSRKGKGKTELDSPDKPEKPDSAQPTLDAGRTAVYPATARSEPKEAAPRQLASIGDTRPGKAWPGEVPPEEAGPGQAWRRPEPRRDTSGLSRIQMLSTLKRAVIWAEILKPPRGLEPPE